MTEEQWQKLSAYIKSEAIAAHYDLDERAKAIRREYEREAHDALVQGVAP